MSFSTGNIITNLTGEEPVRYCKYYLLGKIEEPYEQYAEVWGNMLKTYITQSYNLNYFTGNGYNCRGYFKVVDCMYNYPDYSIFIEPLYYLEENALARLCKTRYTLLPYLTNDTINYFIAKCFNKTDI